MERIASIELRMFNEEQRRGGMTPSDHLAAAGRALYGRQWQSALARDLGVNDRTMRRWAAGQEPPETIWAEVRSLLEARKQTIRETLKVLPS